MERVLWALPRNAADMARERQEAETSADFESSIPDIEDPRVKQVLLPGNAWRDGEYLAVSMVPSCGVLHEMWRRVFNRKLPHKKWMVQPMAVALPNHGEMLMRQGGAVALLRRGLADIRKGQWRGDFVCLRARVEHVNISGGMLAVGWPSLTAVGGFVHTLERETGLDLEFALGLNRTDWIDGVPKFPVDRRIGRQVSVKPGYSTEEITGTLDLVLLLREREGGYDRALTSAVRRMIRFAGGSMFDIRVSTHRDKKPVNAAYLIDATADVARLRKSEDCDALDAALMMYGLDGEWREEGWFQPRNGYTLNQSGYAQLEHPTQRRHARDNCPHVWAEPVFSLVTQGAVSDAAWWRREKMEGGWLWKG